MSYEYSVACDRPPCEADLEAICSKLSILPIFEKATLTKYGIYVPDETGREFVGIGRTEGNLFVTANLNGANRNELLGIIEHVLLERGIYVTIEEE